MDPGLVDLAYARARPFFDEAPRKTAVVVVGCGSSDPDANGDLCKMVRRLGEGRDLAWVVPGFIGYPSGGHLWVGHQKEVMLKIANFVK